MLSKFNEKAQKIVAVSESIAFDLGHVSVGSEHLLLAFLKVKDSKLRMILANYSITYEKIKDQIIALFGKKDTQPYYMEYTSSLKKIMEQSYKEASKNKEEKVKLYESKRNINKWADKLESDNEFGYTHKLTNRLELSIVSINGNDDRDYISEYVRNMNVRDALALRRYIGENEPGLDYAVTVQRPESLGGGSMPVFLSLDEYLFLNIAQ